MPFNSTVYILYTVLQSGEGGIRTLDGVAPIAIFETAPFNRSGTSPMSVLMIDTLRTYYMLGRGSIVAR